MSKSRLQHSKSVTRCGMSVNESPRWSRLAVTFSQIIRTDRHDPEPTNPVLIRPQSRNCRSFIGMSSSSSLVLGLTALGSGILDPWIGYDLKVVFSHFFGMQTSAAQVCSDRCRSRARFEPVRVVLRSPGRDAFWVLVTTLLRSFQNVCVFWSGCLLFVFLDLVGGSLTRTSDCCQ